MHNRWKLPSVAWLPIKKERKKKYPTDCHSVARSVGNEDDFLCIALMHRVRDRVVKETFGCFVKSNDYTVLMKEETKDSRIHGQKSFVIRHDSFYCKISIYLLMWNASNETWGELKEFLLYCSRFFDRQNFPTMIELFFYLWAFRKIKFA